MFLFIFVNFVNSTRVNNILFGCSCFSPALQSFSALVISLTEENHFYGKGLAQEKKEHKAASCYMRQETLSRGMQGVHVVPVSHPPLLGGFSHRGHVTCSILCAFWEF